MKAKFFKTSLFDRQKTRIQCMRCRTLPLDPINSSAKGRCLPLCKRNYWFSKKIEGTAGVMKFATNSMGNIPRATSKAFIAYVTQLLMKSQRSFGNDLENL